MIARPVAVAAGAGVGVLALVLASWPHVPRLMWNASASAPIGLYAVQPETRFARGDWVAAQPLPAMARLAATRGYLSLDVPLVKRIAAGGGDQVCGAGEWISINGKRVAVRLHSDRQGRPLPRWQGCERLRGDEVLLLNDARASFDGRYFGPVPASQIVGQLVPLWTR